MSKLLVELVPTTCHYSNVRSMVTPAEWDKIRKLSYAAANNVCEICKSNGKKQGYKHAVECHEIWDYNDETHTQTLVGLISLCPLCHLCKHIGRAIAMGNETVAYNHIAHVNKWSQEKIREHILESFKVHKERSKYKWRLDITLLKNNPYNIKIDENKERVFETKTYKKKAKKKSTGPKKLHPAAKLAAALKNPSKNKRPPKK